MHTKKVSPGKGRSPLYIEQGPRTIRVGGMGAAMLVNLVRCDIRKANPQYMINAHLN
jgi:hypothetical protein